MELTMLDASLRAIAPLERIKSVIWRRNRTGTGAIRVVCAAVEGDLAENGRYLYRPDTGEGAILTALSQGDGEVVLQGYELGYILSLRRLKSALARRERLDHAILEAIRSAFSGRQVFRGLTVGEGLEECDLPFVGCEAGVDLNALSATHLLPCGMRIGLRLSGEAIRCEVERVQDRSAEIGYLGRIEEAHPILSRDRLPALRALVRGTEEGGEALLLPVESPLIEGATTHSCFFRELLVDGTSVKRRFLDAEGVLHERSEAEYRALLTLLGKEALGEAQGGIVHMILSADNPPAVSAYLPGDRVRISDRIRGIGLLGRLLEIEERHSSEGDRIRVTLGLEDADEQTQQT